jgi:hypothetical protein
MHGPPTVVSANVDMHCCPRYGVLDADRGSDAQLTASLASVIAVTVTLAGTSKPVSLDQSNPTVKLAEMSATAGERVELSQFKQRVSSMGAGCIPTTQAWEEIELAVHDAAS